MHLRIAVAGSAKSGRSHRRVARYRFLRAFSFPPELPARDTVDTGLSPGGGGYLSGTQAERLQILALDPIYVGEQHVDRVVYRDVTPGQPVRSTAR